MDDKSFNIRVPKKWARVGMIVMVTALIVAPLTAIASHSFTDVPDSNTFHEDIAWLADAGVTKGCNPSEGNTEFCPEDFTTRGQMAAFMRRFAQYLDAEDGTPGLADHATTADSAATADGADTLEGLSADDLAPISIVGEDTAETFSANADDFDDIPGASTEITVPDGHTALIVSRFTAESRCTGGDWATVRLVLDGSEMSPVVGTDFSFDSSDAGTESSASWESHAVERFEANVGAGTHTVTAQYNSGCTSFRLDDWTLTAEARLGGSGSVVSLGSGEDDTQGR